MYRLNNKALAVVMTVALVMELVILKTASCLCHKNPRPFTVP